MNPSFLIPPIFQRSLTQQFPNHKVSIEFKAMHQKISKTILVRDDSAFLLNKSKYIVDFIDKKHGITVAHCSN
jgi:hypothetical protein